MWDFAVEIGALRALGLSDNDLRWLTCKSYALHAREVTLGGEVGRAFRPEGDLSFGERTCFVLTEEGVACARLILSQASVVGELPLRVVGLDGSIRAAVEDHHETPKPLWDKDLRELRLGGQLVKRFRVPSPNQETVLAAFQEESWPCHIDDPLSPITGQNSKRRLHDTIKSLNRGQENRLLAFCGDGTGLGIRWGYVPHRQPLAAI